MKMDDLKTIHADDAKIINSEESVQCGDWYWVKTKRDDETEWLGCVAKVGSNYIKLYSVPTDCGYRNTRIHHKDFFSLCRPVEDPKPFIQAQIQKYQNNVNDALIEIKSITKRLGISKQHALEMKRGGGTGSQLVVMSQSTDIKLHEASLIKAKEETLPALFKQVKENTDMVASWMKAEALPLTIAKEQMEDDISDIDSRIFNVKLYGGIDEHIHVIKEGDHAAIDEKIHVFQNKKYMDEECLANYVSGGMDFNDVDKFCDWLLLDDNLQRILPYPKSVVPFQIRRHEKLRRAMNIIEVFENMSAARLDESTYFLVRNGEAVYFIDSLVKFDKKIFPDQSEFDPTQPIYFKVGSFKKIDWMHENEFLSRKAQCQAADKKFHQWEKDNPDASWIHNPFRNCIERRFEYKRYELLNDDSLYFDDFQEHQSEILRSYNRISLVLQGLLDRSSVLHPHTNVQTWNNESFNQNIKLVYDHDRTLPEGEKPDIDAYIAKCNKNIKSGSVVYGQAEYWLEHEREKEQRRRDRSYHEYGDITYFSGPYGNPGPGRVAEVAGMVKKGSMARFVWHRARIGYNVFDSSPIKSTINVPVDKLFNMDAYKPGDFKEFYKDPRTRAEYIEWAPMLLAAEDYQAGLLKPKPAHCEDVDWK